MKRFGIIGHPVAGSMSPVLFGAAYEGRYPYDLIDRDTFAEAWQVFLDGYDGINVTAPYKQDAFAAVDWLSEGARLSGAVNLVTRDGGLLRGYNTDINGVEEALRESGFSFADALVVGTGGAARAAIVAALHLGCEVTVAGRSPEKVEALSSRFGCRGMLLADFCARPEEGVEGSMAGGTVMKANCDAEDTVKKADGNAMGTPSIAEITVGEGSEGRTPPVAEMRDDAPSGVLPSEARTTSLRPSLVIYTLPGSVPVPPGLPLKDAVVLEAEYKRPVLSSAPCKAYISGRRWLIWQAVAGYSLFTGEEPSLQKILQAL